MHTLKNVGKALYSIMLIVIALAIIATVTARIVAETTGQQPNLFGYTPTIVVSGSMLPTIEVNSLSIIKDTDFDNIEVGDIIVYWSSTKHINILHRVIGIDTTDSGEKCYITQGDANPVEDPEVTTLDNYRGQVIATYNWTAPFLGKVVQGGRVIVSELMKVVVLAILFLWLILSGIYCIVYIIFSTIYKLVSKGRVHHGL